MLKLIILVLVGIDFASDRPPSKTCYVIPYLFRKVIPSYDCFVSKLFALNS